MTYFIFTYFSVLLILLSVQTGNDWNVLASFSTGFATIIAALIAVKGVKDTIEKDRENKKKELLDNLDSKSEWRKQLFDVASKTTLNTDDVYRVLAALRYLPKEKDESNDFDKISCIIFSEMYEIIKRKYSNMKEDFISDADKALTFNESEIVRLYTKHLLKHHWEYNGNDKEKYIENEKRQFSEIYKCVNKIKEEKCAKEYLEDMKTKDESLKDFIEEINN